jgi:predicted SAM-dependent methyltransferase
MLKNKRRINFKCNDLKVILGCGNSKKDGWIGLDIGDYGQEVLWDMRDGLPFPDDSCSELFADQVLEHIQLNDDYIFLMNECLRVLKSGGKFEIFAPYYESEVAYKDPTHCRFFTKHTFTYMVKENSWEYGFDKRWVIEKSEIINGSQIHAVLIAKK